MIHLLPATIEDSKDLYKWRTSPSTMEAMRDPSEIKYEDHLDWLNRSIVDLWTARMFIATENWKEVGINEVKRLLYVARHNDISIGTVRADKEGLDWELSWTVDESYRGKGLGKLMVSDFTQQLARFSLKAEIKKFNTASQKIAKLCGMDLVNESEEYLNFKRAPIKVLHNAKQE
jgi:RimJ/RimL family protein N-acetyltransferase